MSSTDATMSDSAVPAPNPTVGAPAPVDQARNLVAEKDAEATKDRAVAKSKENRFMARKMTVPDRPRPAAPEYESYILETAVNNPLMNLKSPTISTFIPNVSTIFYLLMYMDHTMANTKRWLDNCMGWAPPISQMYIGILVYYQIIRAMDAASAIAPGSPMHTFLRQFEQVFSLHEIWIPGPLVSAFRSLSAFWPTATDRFGNVTPTLPAQPGWNRANTMYNLGQHNATDINTLLPNISLFITRLRTIANTAALSADQATFTASHDGPLFFARAFNRTMNNHATEQQWTNSPGIAFAYPDNHAMWRNCNSRIASLAIPVDLRVGTDDVPNDWITFFRFDNNQHVWFGNVSAVMSKYCQFFHGSAPLSDILPNCSAANAVKGRTAAGWDLGTAPAYTAAVAAAAGPPAVAAVPAHYTLRFSARAVSNVRLALEDVPDAHVYAAMTWNLNTYGSQARQNALRQGPFWSLGPDVAGRDGIEVLPGTQSTIVRKYHSDVRIAADKQ